MASNTNSKDTRRLMEFASMVRNMSDSQVAEMIYSNDVQKYGLDLNIFDRILASRMQCKPEDIKRCRISESELMKAKL